MFVTYVYTVISMVLRTILVLKYGPGNPYGRGRLSTVDLLLLTGLDRLLFLVKMVYLHYKTSYFNEEVTCTEPSSLVSVPCMDT